MSEIDITIFVPCLDEEKYIENTIKTIVAAVNEVRLSYEILIFDDYSSDNTVSVIKNYQRQHSDIPIKLIRNNTTKGLGHNYIEGAYIGKGEYYILVCGDNPHTKEYFVTLMENIGTADIIIPYYDKLKRKELIRKILSDTFIKIVNFLSGYSIQYYNGEVIHLRYNVMRWHPDTKGYAYQAEIICRLLDEGKTYKELLFRAIESGHSSSFTLRKILSVAHSLLQIILRRIRKFSYKIL